MSYRAPVKAAVVLMAYGSPERLADVPAYYADIRGGRPIAPENLADLVERYRRLGIEDSSPLNAITEETRAALEQELELPVFTGMKHWTPRIADAAEAALAGGADVVAGLVLAPHYSAMSIKGYRDQLEQAMAGRAELAFVDSWHDEPGFVDLLADKVRGTGAHVVFTAHSLPARILDEGDPYKDQLLETAQLVAERAALGDDWSFSFQSESPTGEPWLGPDILDHLTALHEAGIRRRADLPRRLRLRPSRDPLGHRRRGRGTRGGAGHDPRADRDAERRSGLRADARGDRPACARGTVTSVKPGEITVEHAARKFRVYPREQRTLKDVVFSRGRIQGNDVWALRDISFSVARGSAVGLVGRNGSGKTTLLRLLSGIIKPTSGSVDVGGRIGSLLELGAGFHPDMTGRENVYLNGSIHGLSRTTIREKLDEIVAFAGLEEFIDLPVRTYSSGMYMRLGFAVASHIEADVLLLDEVFAVGDEAFQRKCFGKIFEFKQRGGTIVFVSHDASAVERLCDRAVLLKDGTVAFDGPTHEAIVEYRRLLAGERNPEERAAGLKEWGGDTARVEGARLLGPDGDTRAQGLLAGEPFSISVDVSADSALPPPRIVWELRDDAGILVASGVTPTADFGWDDATRRMSLRFDADRPPFSDGRLRLRVDLTDATGEQYHSLDDALVFVVYPADESRGLVRLEGRWSRQEIAAAAELERA